MLNIRGKITRLSWNGFFCEKVPFGKGLVREQKQTWSCKNEDSFNLHLANSTCCTFWKLLALVYTGFFSSRFWNDCWVKVIGLNFSFLYLNCKLAKASIKYSKPSKRYIHNTWIPVDCVSTWWYFKIPWTNDSVFIVTTCKYRNPCDACVNVTVAEFSN